MMKMDDYMSYESIIKEPQVIGFLDEWFTTNEIISYGTNFKAESSREEEGMIVKSVTICSYQDKDKTIVEEKLYVTYDGTDEIYLSMDNKVTIQHHKPFEDITSEYFNESSKILPHIIKMMKENYGYTVVKNERRFNGYNHNKIRDKRYNYLAFRKIFDNEEMTLKEYNSILKDDFKYLNESSKLFKEAFVTYDKGFCKDKLCIWLYLYHIIQ